jgi:pimeloyl-ACP methyl ester carboxylesterase
LSVGQISWSQFVQAQLPAVRLTMLVSAVTVAIAEGTRHLGLPPLVVLIGGSLGAAITAVIAAALVPKLALGEQGTRVRDTLRAYVIARMRPARLRGSA